MLPEKGTYIAGLLEWAVNQPDGKCPSFDVFFECRQVRQDGQWSPSNGERIKESFNLVKRDGNLNEINVRGLRDALGWDGASFAALNNGPWDQAEVQIVVGEEAGSDGKMYKAVRYINPRDYTGPARISGADAQTLTSLDQKYGAMLRALTGAKPGAPAAKPAPQTKPAPAAPGGVLTAETAKGLCWKAFSDACDEYQRDNPNAGYDAARKTAVFKELIAHHYPGRESKTLTAQEWDGLRAAIAEDFSPAAAGFVPF